MEREYSRGVVEDIHRWKDFTAGMWAWIFHKFTGWVLIGYLFMHIPVLSGALVSPEIYTTRLQSLESLFIIRVLEVGLLSVAVFHILNGTRLLLVDLGVGLDAHEKSFYAALVLTGIITIASVPTFLQGVF